MARSTFYVQLEPEFRRERLVSVKAKAVTLGRPTYPRGRGGTVAIKMTVEIPDAAFYPLQPEAIIEVPLDETLPLRVEVESPSYDT